METFIFLMIVYFLFGYGYAIGRDVDGLPLFLAMTLLWPIFVGASVGDAS